MAKWAPRPVFQALAILSKLPGDRAMANAALDACGKAHAWQKALEMHLAMAFHGRFSCFDASICIENGAFSYRKAFEKSVFMRFAELPVVSLGSFKRVLLAVCSTSQWRSALSILEQMPSHRLRLRGWTALGGRALGCRAQDVLRAPAGRGPLAVGLPPSAGHAKAAQRGGSAVPHGGLDGLPPGAAVGGGAPRGLRAAAGRGLPQLFHGPLGHRRPLAESLGALRGPENGGFRASEGLKVSGQEAADVISFTTAMQAMQERWAKCLLLLSELTQAVLEPDKRTYTVAPGAKLDGNRMK